MYMYVVHVVVVPRKAALDGAHNSSENSSPVTPQVHRYRKPRSRASELGLWRSARLRRRAPYEIAGPRGRLCARDARQPGDPHHFHTLANQCLRQSSRSIARRDASSAFSAFGAMAADHRNHRGTHRAPARWCCRDVLRPWLRAAWGVQPRAWPLRLSAAECRTNMQALGRASVLDTVGLRATTSSMPTVGRRPAPVVRLSHDVQMLGGLSCRQSSR